MCFIQDSFHVGTKLRNRLLKLGIVIPIGSKIASVSHLKVLINQVSKDIHGLVMKIVCPDDRQNFSSFEKIISEKTIDALSKYVTDSEGTIMYLKLCSNVTLSLIEHDLRLLQRVKRMWSAVYFLS